MTDIKARLKALEGRLIVSTQAYPGEPMRDPRTMAQVAQSAVRGGAAGIRLQGLEDIRTARPLLDVPIIGLVKHGDEGVYITPSVQHALDCAGAGADVVAIDGTRRRRPDGTVFADAVRAVHEETPALVMADCGSLQDAVSAAEAGADFIGTTLAGYTEDRPKTEGPDLDLIAEIAAASLPVPLIAEGRIHTPLQAKAALEAGAWAVVVGTAITHPTTITTWFSAALQS